MRSRTRSTPREPDPVDGQPPAGDVDTTRFRWRWLVEDAPAALWAIAALHVALLLLWSLLAPTYDAPDEPQHVDVMLGVAAQGAYPAHDERYLAEAMVESFDVASYEPRRADREPVSSEEAPARSERPSFDELGADDPPPGDEQFNQIPQHPPLYYLLGAGVLTLTDGTSAFAFDQAVWVLRLLSVLLLAPVPVLTFSAARKLTGRTELSLAAAVLPVAVPMYVHIGSVVNNDTALVLTVAAMFPPLVWTARGDHSLRTGGWIGLLGGLAALVKGFALFAPLWIGLAVVLGAVRTRRWGAAVGQLAIAGVIMAALSGWWWVRNILRHGSVQPTSSRFPPAGPDFEPDLAAWIDEGGRFLVSRFWGSFGWVDVTLPWGLVRTMFLIMCLLLAAGLVIRRRHDRWTRVELALMLVPAVAITAMFTWHAWQAYVDHDRLVGLQGRYLFPGLPGMAIVAACGWAALGRFASRFAPLFALVAMAVGQWEAVRQMLFNYYGEAELGDARLSIEAWLAWAPWPPPFTVTVMVLTAVAGTVTGVWLALMACRPPAPADTEAATSRETTASDHVDTPRSGGVCDGCRPV